MILQFEQHLMAARQILDAEKDPRVQWRYLIGLLGNQAARQPEGILVWLLRSKEHGLIHPAAPH